MNGEIRQKEVRVIGDDGSQLGVISTSSALKLAEEKELDLVVVSPNAVPPVCKIMDIGKYLYEQTKKEKENRKNQKIVNIKEVRLSASIEEHDILIKSNNARKFLTAGDKVKVTVRFRGRQADYAFKGNTILNNFVEKINDICVIEKPARLEGKNMTMIVAPKKA